MDADTGVAVGWLTTGGFESGLLRTTDGGYTWSKAGGGGLGVHITAEGDGCLGGGSGSFAKSADAFQTRIGISGPNVAIRCTWTIDANTMIVTGGAAAGGICRTSNGGANWTHVLDVGNITISDLWFVNDLQGYAVGEYGDNYRTIDGGLTWDPLPPISGSHTVFFADEQHGWTRNFRTTDGGDTWISMAGTPQSTMSIFFTDIDTGYAVASTGQTVKSVDGGITWENVLPEIFNASVGDATCVDGRIILVCSNGDIFRAQVGCSSVTEIPEVSVDGQLLCTTLPGTAQWYRNGEAVDGATDPCYLAEQGGLYHVIVVDAFGCSSAASEPVQVLITSAPEVLSAASFRIFPNPSTGAFRLDRANEGPAIILILDAQGRIVNEQLIVGASAMIDIHLLYPGMYLMRVIGATDEGTLRVVKE